MAMVRLWVQVEEDSLKKRARRRLSEALSVVLRPVRTDLAEVEVLVRREV